MAEGTSDRHENHFSNPQSQYGNEASILNVRNFTSFNFFACPQFTTMHTGIHTVNVNTVSVDSEKLSSTELCQRFMSGECALNEYCPYIHGDLCELCNKPCLLPNDEKQRKIHTELCKEMELPSSIQRGMEKTCGICYDVVLEKVPVSERKFGILEKCNHVYCFTCIKKWRKSRRMTRGVTKTCPECRTPSDFVIPNFYFVETDKEKEQLIVKYKEVLSEKDCKHFKKGKGICPFGGACFHLHTTPDGTKVELPLRRMRMQPIRDMVLNMREMQGEGILQPAVFLSEPRVFYDIHDFYLEEDI